LFRAPLAVRFLDAVRTYAPRARVLLHTVDLHYLREQRQAALQNDHRLGEAAAQTKAIELETIRACDGTIVVSEFERQLLASSLPEANVFLLPYVMEVAGCAAGFAERNGILFVGGFRHAPNVDAVQFFVREVLPRIRATLPGVPFRVVGSHPPAELLA